MATASNWEDIIRTNYSDLLKVIDTDNGLQGEIRKLKIFTPIALKTFWDHKDKTERIDRMLRNLQRKDYDSFRLFCTALDDSNQNHVVKNHLSRVKEIPSRQGLTVTDSASDIDSSQNRGISREVKECLQQKWNDLVASIAFDESLIAEIDSFKIMTSIQLNRLRDKNTEAERTEYMLNHLERGSEKQFEGFCQALKCCGQHHIVEEHLKPRSLPRGPTVNGSSSVTAPRLSRHSSSSEPVRSPPIGEAPIQRHPLETPLRGNEFCAATDDFRRKIEEEVRLMEAYRCDHTPRGRAIIINNEYFRPAHLMERMGAQKDVEGLKQLFEQLHFDTKVYQDQTAEDINEILENESKDTENLHSQCDMFVLFIMSHGICGELFGIDGEAIKTTKILELFDGKNCPNLRNKPKLIFIQACQGNLKTPGVNTDGGYMTMTDSVGDVVTCSIRNPEVLEKLSGSEDVGLSVPLEDNRNTSVYQNDALPSGMVHEKADMAVFYATVEGHVAWRRKDTGSVFVQILIDVFKRSAKEEDVMSMMTKVLKLLHEHDVVEGENRFKQIGEKRDTLRKKVYLLP